MTQDDGFLMPDMPDVIAKQHPGHAARWLAHQRRVAEVDARASEIWEQHGSWTCLRLVARWAERFPGVLAVAEAGFFVDDIGGIAAAFNRRAFDEAISDGGDLELAVLWRLAALSVGAGGPGVGDGVVLGALHTTARSVRAMALTDEVIAAATAEGVCDEAAIRVEMEREAR